RRRSASRPGRWPRLHLAVGVLAVAAVLGRADAPQAPTTVGPSEVAKANLKVLDIPVRLPQQYVLGRPPVAGLLITSDRKSVAFQLALTPRTQLLNPDTLYYVCDVEKGTLRELFSRQENMVRGCRFSSAAVAVTRRLVTVQQKLYQIALRDVRTG